MYRPYEDPTRICSNLLRARATNSNYAHPTNSPQDIDKCSVITTLSTDFKVIAISESVNSMLGDITGRTLITADWVNDATTQLMDGRPYVCELQSGDKGGFKYFCQLFPVFKKDLDVNAQDCILWIISKCPYIETSSQINYLIRILINRTIESLMRKHGDAILNSQSSMLSILSRAQQIIETTSEINIVTLIEIFMDWVDTAEFYVWKNPPKKEASTNHPSKIKDEADFSDASRSSSECSSEMELGDGNDLDVDGNGATQSTSNDMDESNHDNHEALICTLLGIEIDTIFYQLRECGIIPHLISMLKAVTSRQDAMSLGKFVSYCLSKHNHPKIRLLMREVQSLIANQKFEAAYNVLSEVRLLFNFCE